MVSVRSVYTQPSSLTANDLPWIIEHREDRCTLCGKCTAVCPKQAIYLTYRRQRVPKLDIHKKTKH
ncbi:MAG: 4Fe-4S dicluster domain-containing protein, partial [Candidatus Electrothrix sp. GM3_4]|nr:4Fe-4S dicluster domain-containing protein [Candidatus Electrothrix sp. GM3_4]